MTLNCTVVDLPFLGSSYTWCRNSSPPLWKHLDRIIVNSDWNNYFSLSKFEHLNKAPSDHSPFLFTFSHTLPRGSVGFRF